MTFALHSHSASNVMIFYRYSLLCLHGNACSILHECHQHPCRHKWHWVWSGPFYLWVYYHFQPAGAQWCVIVLFLIIVDQTFYTAWVYWIRILSLLENVVGLWNLILKLIMILQESYSRRYLFAYVKCSPLTFGLLYLIYQEFTVMIMFSLSTSWYHSSLQH